MSNRLYSWIKCAWAIGVGLVVGGARADIPGSGTVGVSREQLSGCTSCGGGPDAVADGPAMWLNLGYVTNRVGQALLGFSSQAPGSELTQPELLEVSGDTNLWSTLEVVRDEGEAIAQVVTPESFVDVVRLMPSGYRVDFYQPAGKGPFADGRYWPTNITANLTTSWSVLDTDGPALHDRFAIMEQKTDGAIRLWSYAYDSTDSSWTLIQPDQVTRHRATSLLSTNGAGTVKLEILSSSNAVAYTVEKTFTAFAWGSALTQTKIGTNGNLLTNTISYYTTTNAAGYAASTTLAPTKDVLNTDGTWKSVGAYDTNGRPLVVYSGSGGTTAPSTNSAVTQMVEYDYTPLTSLGDEAALNPRKPRMETRKVNGTAISRTFYIYSTNETRVIRCDSPSGSATNSGNLVTLTKLHPSGTWAGYEQSVENPDGTMTFYDYAATATNRTTTVSSGEPNGGKTAIQNGTQTVTVVGNVGEMISRTSKNISGGTVGVILGSETYSNYDAFHRPQRVTALDGTYTEISHDCCGVGSTTDRDGLTVEYIYDVFKRLVATSRLGVVTTNIFDAAGRTVAQWRIGTDGSSVFLGGTGYAPSGEVTSSTNAFGGVTTYAETFNGSGFRVRTTTQPDGGTRIETFWADGQLERITGTAVSPVRYEYGVESTTDSETGTHTWEYSKEIKLDSSGSDTGEWVKSYTDSLGRSAKTVYADGAYALSIYNPKGQLVKSIDPDKVTTLYQYNAQGELEYTALDVNQNGTIDFTGLDRVTQTVRDVTTISSINVQRTRTYVLATDNSGTTLQVGESRVSTDGLQSWSIAFGQTAQSVTTVDTLNGVRTVTVTHPDGSTTATVYKYGRVEAVTRRNSGGTLIARTSNYYDPHGRLSMSIDARNGNTYYTYTSGDAVYTVTTPVPGTGAAGQTVTSFYDTSGRAWKTTQPDGTSVTNEFHLTGQLKKTYGSRSYPVEYTYDPSGRMKTMKTWQNFTGNSGTAITTWNYHTTRGWLLSKDYANASTGAAGTTGSDYTYTAGGRLKTRTWARNHSGGSRIVTTYKYGFDDAASNNSHGELTELSYNDSATATVSYGYNRRGQQTTVTQGSTTTTRHYNDAGQSLGESYSGGTLGGLNVTNTFDSYLRRSTVSSRNGTTTLGSSTYGYDTASRLLSVTDGTYSATYAYLANSSLIDTITFKTNTTTRLTTKRQYDKLNRLQSIVSTPSSASQATPAYGYHYNDANQRTRLTLGDGSYWVYNHDALGQVKSGKRYWNDHTPVPGQQFEYRFDDIGNRAGDEAVMTGGDASGANLRAFEYEVNRLNQYTMRNGPTSVDILGLGSPGTTVTVNGSPADYRRGEYFREDLTVANGSAAVWQGVTNTVGSTTVTGNVFVPAQQELFSYDLDGNLTGDGRWTYTWDAENRLIAMESLTNAPSGSKRKLTFEYDANSRRIGKKVYVWNGSAYPGSPNTTLRFLYDGWNLLAELDGSNVVVRSYQWGTDLSGSIQGAGGVGGLLSVKPNGSVAQFVAYDGNGNVMALVDGASGVFSANYEYGPFGELLRSSGTQAVSPVRFSSKYQDAETELLYYGFRYYNASNGRWICRDILSELDQAHLYRICNNSTISHFDILGMASAKESATEAMSEINKLFSQNDIARLMGLDTFSKSKLTPVLSKISKFKYFGGGISTAEFEYPQAVNFYRSTMKLKRDYAASDVFHETIHAYNNLMLQFDPEPMDELDETMAYLGEAHYGFILAEDAIEKILKGNNPCNRKALKLAWGSLWSGTGYSHVNQWATGIIWKYPTPGNRPSTTTDLDKFYSLYQVKKMTCSELKKILNAKLENAGCCFRFSCDYVPVKEQSERYLTPIVAIDDYFK